MSACADTGLYLRFAPTKPPGGVLAADAVTIPSAGIGERARVHRERIARLHDQCNSGFA